MLQATHFMLIFYSSNENNIGDQRNEGTSLLGHKGFEDTVVILNNLKYIVLKGLKGFTGSDFNFSPNETKKQK